jgi:hypothetical protein
MRQREAYKANSTGTRVASSKTREAAGDRAAGTAALRMLLVLLTKHIDANLLAGMTVQRGRATRAVRTDQIQRLPASNEPLQTARFSF